MYTIVVSLASALEVTKLKIQSKIQLRIRYCHVAALDVSGGQSRQNL